MGMLTKLAKGGLGFRCLVVLSIVASVSLFADVVELKSGDRLQGRFRQAPAAGVVIEVGGQSINVPLEKVRAIYLGDAPVGTATHVSPVREALQALEALQSVTSAGVNYREYSPRVLDAKVKVDQYLLSPDRGNPGVRSAIQAAMRYHEIAFQAWNLKIAGSNFSLAGSVELGRSIRQELAECPTVKVFLSDADALMLQHPMPFSSSVISEEGAKFSMTAFLIGQNPAVIWPCASEKISEARRLLSGGTQSAPQTQPASTPVAAPAKPAPADANPADAQPGETTVVTLP